MSIEQEPLANDDMTVSNDAEQEMPATDELAEADLDQVSGGGSHPVAC